VCPCCYSLKPGLSAHSSALETGSARNSRRIGLCGRPSRPRLLHPLAPNFCSNSNRLPVRFHHTTFPKIRSRSRTRQQAHSPSLHPWPDSAARYIKPLNRIEKICSQSSSCVAIDLARVPPPPTLGGRGENVQEIAATTDSGVDRHLMFIS
jgi:hypothetical protein